MADTVAVALVGGPLDGVEWRVPREVWEAGKDIMLKLADGGRALPGRHVYCPGYERSSRAVYAGIVEDKDGAGADGGGVTGGAGGLGG